MHYDGETRVLTLYDNSLNPDEDNDMTITGLDFKAATKLNSFIENQKSAEHARGRKEVLATLDEVIARLKVL